jgi:Amt family ammonium transporter
MLQSFMAMIIVTVLWVVIAFGLSFGPTIGGIIENPLPNLFSKRRTNTAWSLAQLYRYVIALFQAKFAIITPALITGLQSNSFLGILTFMVLFILLVYAPLAHMTWHPDGIFFKMGVLDFAGGTVVHMSADGLHWLEPYSWGKENTKSKSCSYPYVY